MITITSITTDVTTTTTTTTAGITIIQTHLIVETSSGKMHNNAWREPFLAFLAGLTNYLLSVICVAACEVPNLTQGTIKTARCN